MQEIERATFVSFAAIRPYSLHHVLRERLSLKYPITDLRASQILIWHRTKMPFNARWFAMWRHHVGTELEL